MSIGTAVRFCRRSLKFFAVLSLTGVITSHQSAEAAMFVNAISGRWVEATGGTEVIGLSTEEIQWGIPFPSSSSRKSGYLFEEMASPFEVPLNTQFVIGDFTHNNFVIRNGTSIESAVLDIDMTVNVMPGVDQTLSGLTFSFDHTETPNTGGPVDDIVMVSAVNTDATFNVDGATYTLTLLGFSQDGGETIMDSFLTVEEESNVAQLYGTFTVAESQLVVPEPHSIAIFGLGALGLVSARRRRMNA